MEKSIWGNEHDFFKNLRTEIHQAGKFVYRDVVSFEGTCGSKLS